jgi:hypothetical protein
MSTTALRYFAYPAGLFIGAFTFVFLAASFLPGTQNDAMTEIARIAAAVAVSFVIFTNIALIDYLIAISASSDANRHRPTAIALSAALFLALIALYAGIYVVEMPQEFNDYAQDFGAGACLTRVVKALYFSSITITTVGYGDISPRNSFAQITAALEAINGLVSFGVFTGALTGYISTKASSG